MVYSDGHAGKRISYCGNSEAFWSASDRWDGTWTAVQRISDHVSSVTAGRQHAIHHHFRPDVADLCDPRYALMPVIITLAHSRVAHSQTLPNKSSAFPLSPPCFGPVLVATGLACDHPPNSSSCCTEKPPAREVPVSIGLDGSGSPHPESKALCVDTLGAGGD